MAADRWFTTAALTWLWWVIATISAWFVWAHLARAAWQSRNATTDDTAGGQ